MLSTRQLLSQVSPHYLIVTGYTYRDTILGLHPTRPTDDVILIPIPQNPI